MNTTLKQTGKFYSMRDNFDPAVVGAILNNHPSDAETYVLNHNAYESNTSTGIKLSFKRIKKEKSEGPKSFIELENASENFIENIPSHIIKPEIKPEPGEQFQNNHNYRDEPLNPDSNLMISSIEQEYSQKFGENNNFETSIKRELYETADDEDDFFEEYMVDYHDNNTSKISKSKADEEQNIEYEEIKLENETSVSKIIKQVHHKTSTKYACNQCNYSSSLKTSFKRHLQIHDNSKEAQWYYCDKCNYKTKQKGHLSRHGLSHKDLSECTKIFICEICQYKFKQKCSLRRHILDIHGSHKSGSKSDLHLDIPVFNCNQCSYSSIRRSLFLAHLDKHKDPKDVSNLYICDICKFSTKYRRNLRVHLETHMEKPDKTIHECKICDFRTRQHYCLKRHLLSKKHLTVVGKLTEYCPRELRMRQEESERCKEELNVGEEEFVKIESSEIKMEVDDVFEDISTEVKEEHENDVEVKVDDKSNIFVFKKEIYC